MYRVGAMSVIDNTIIKLETPTRGAHFVNSPEISLTKDYNTISGKC